MVISSNLKNLLKEYNINQKELSIIAGVSESTVGKWILGKATPRMGTIQTIADHFDIPKSSILEENEVNSTIRLRNGVSRIPILGKIACGTPIWADENIEGYKHEYIDNIPSGNLFYLETKGKSMEPTIPDKCYVLIREQSDVENGEIAAIRINGDEEVTLKRVKKQNNIIMLMPDNNDFEPIIVTSDNPATILGKAMKYTVEL